MVKMFHNPMHLTNYKVRDGLRVFSNTYTQFLPIEAKTNKTCLEAVNRFVSVSMVKICHNPMQLSNYKS